MRELIEIRTLLFYVHPDTIAENGSLRNLKLLVEVGLPRLIKLINAQPLHE